MRTVYQIFIFFSLLALLSLLPSNSFAALTLKLDRTEIVPWGGDTEINEYYYYEGYYYEGHPYYEAHRKLNEPGLHPWGEIKLQYDDNVFLDSSDEKDDFIITLSPGIAFRQPFQEDSLLSLDYHAEINKYSDNTSQDATNHFLSGAVDFNWRDLTFKVYDDFKRVYEHPSVEDTERVKRDDNSIGAAGRWQRDRLGIQLGYEHFTRNYRDNDVYEQYDRAEDIYSLILTHQTFAKTELLFEYDYARINYDENVRPDSSYHQILVGAMGELTPKTAAVIKTGYQFRDYDDEGESDFSSGVLYADISHKFSDKDALKLSLSKTAYESTYGGNNFYKVVNVSAVFDHFFSQKLMGFLTGSYQINSYPEETTEGTQTAKRKDKYYTIGAGLRHYLKRWLTLTLRADHIIRDSNFDVFEYDKNLITLSATAVF